MRAAERHGGNYRSAGNSDIVGFTIAGQPVLIECEDEEATAEARLPYSDLYFEIKPRDGLSLVMAQIQAGAAEAGVETPNVEVTVEHDSKFETEFEVNTYRRADVRRLLTPEVTRLMRKYLKGCRMECENGQIKLHLGNIDDPDPLSAVHDMFTEMLSIDVYGRAALEALGGPGFGETEGVPWAQVAMPAEVYVRAEAHEGKLVTVARLRGDLDMAPLRLQLAEGGQTEQREEHGRLPLSAQQFLPQVGAGTLIVEARTNTSDEPQSTWPGTRFVWTDIITDADALKAGAQLLGALTNRGAGGVFR